MKNTRPRQRVHSQQWSFPASRLAVRRWAWLLLCCFGSAISSASPSEAEIKTAAADWLRKTVQYHTYIATDRGSRGWDDTSVRMIRSSYVKAISADGCRWTIGHDSADLGDPRNRTNRRGVATITIDWAHVETIDASAVVADPYETGMLLRGGITTSLNSKPALRIMGSDINYWEFHARSVQQVCRGARSADR